MRYLVKYTVVFIASLLASSPTFPAVEKLINAHVPVLAGPSEEISVRELTFLTWGAMPESGIVAVLWPYKINSPHEERDGKNINPASMVNLRISPVLYPLSACVVTIDVRDMTSLPAELAKTYGPVSKKDLLMAVVDATGRNLRASEIAGCRLVIEGAELHEELKDVVFPAGFDDH